MPFGDPAGIQTGYVQNTNYWLITTIMRSDT